jgi:hypothetical protein
VRNGGGGWWCVWGAGDLVTPAVHAGSAGGCVQGAPWLCRTQGHSSESGGGAGCACQGVFTACVAPLGAFAAVSTPPAVVTCAGASMGVILDAC